MEKKPERLCVSCRSHQAKGELLRIVRVGETVLPDPTGKAQGRGAYVCRTGPCLQQALREGRLARSLKCRISPEAEQQLLAAWEQIQDRSSEGRILNLIGLARRGRLLACGTQAVELALRKGQAHLLILAQDAAPNGALPLQKKAEQLGIPCYSFGTATQLGQLTGKDVRTALAVTDTEMASGMLPLFAEMAQPQGSEANSVI